MYNEMFLKYDIIHTYHGFQVHHWRPGPVTLPSQTDAGWTDEKLPGMKVGIKLQITLLANLKTSFSQNVTNNTPATWNLS